MRNHNTKIQGKLCLQRSNLSKTATLKRPSFVFQDELSLNAGQKYCRMLQGEHSAIIYSTFIKLPFVIKTFVLSIFEWPFNTGFTVQYFIGWLRGYMPFFMPNSTEHEITTAHKNSNAEK